MKKKILIGIGIIGLAAFCVCMLFLSGIGSRCYYSQIDNSKMEQSEVREGVIDFSGRGMGYLYTLSTYDENGKGKEIQFGTSKKLKEGSFICLTVMPIRGVIEWEEVQFNKLPAAVQNKF